MADVQLIFGIDPTSRSTIESGLNNILSGMHPKVKVNIDTGDVRAAYSEYRRLNGVIESTYKEINKLNSGANPNKDVYSSQLQTQLQRLESLKAALNKGGVFEGTVITGKNFGNLLDEILAKISDIKVAFSTVENGNYMTTLGNSAGQYEQALGKVEEKIRTVSSLQTELNDGTKVADAGTTQKINELGTAFEKLAQDMHGMPAEQFREQFAKLSNELARLQSQVKTPVKLLGDDPTRLANTMGEVQRMMNNVANLQEKMALGKGVAKSGTATELNNMRAALQQFSVEMKNMPADEASQKVAQFRAKIIELTGAVRANSSIFANFFGGFGAGIKSYLAMTFSWYRIIGTTIQELKQMVGTAVDLNSAFTQLQIVTRVSDSQMADFSHTLADTAKNMSASVKDMTEVATVYARLGYSLEESNVLAQYTAMLQNVGDIDSGAASDALTAIVKAYGKGVDDIEGLMDKMVEVGNNFPISVSQIAEGMNNAASMMANAGMSFDESVAMLTAANTTVQNISKSSTGLRTIIARLRNVKSELDDAGEVWNEAKYQELISALTKGGVQLQDATGALRNPYEVLKELADRWSSLTSDVKAAITTALAGTRQQDIFASLMNQFGEATKAMEAMGDSAGALTDAYDIFEDSMQGHINTLKAAFEELSMTAVDKGLVNGFVDMGTALIEAFTPLVGVLGQILKFIGPIGLGFTVIAGLNFKNISGVVKSWRDIDSMQRLINPIESLGMAFGKTGADAVAFGESLMAAAGIAAAAIAAFVVLDKAIFTSDEAMKRASKSAKDYESQKDKVNSLNSELETTQTRIDELKAKGRLSLVEQAELDNLEAANEKLNTQLEIEKQIAQYKQSAAAHDADDALTDSSFSGNWKGHMKLGVSDYNPYSSFYNALASSGNMVEYAKTESEIIKQLTEEEEAYMRHLAELEPGTAEYDATQRALETVHNVRTQFEGDLGNVLDTIRTFEGSLYDDFGNVITGCESTAQAISDLWDDVTSSYDEAAAAQKEIDDFLERPTITKYVDDVKLAFADAGKAMSESEFKKAFPELAEQAEESGLNIIDIIDSIASSIGLLNFDEVKNQLKDLKPEKSRSWVWNDWIDNLDNDSLKKLYNAWQEGIDWSAWTRADFESFFEEVEDSAESATIAIEDLADAHERIDAAEGRINKLTDAYAKLADGSLELSDVIELIEEFPELAEYVDLTADNFGNLDEGLRNVARNEPTALINSLMEFATTTDLTDAQRTAIYELADALDTMPSGAIEDVSGEFITLHDEIMSAKQALNEIKEAMSGDTNTGYATRSEAFQEMMELFRAGAVGSSSKLWDIAEEMGYIGEQDPDTLWEWVRAREAWYDTGEDGKLDSYDSSGIESFLKFVNDNAAAQDWLAANGGKFKFDGSTLDFDFDNANWEEFARVLGLSSEEFTDLMIQAGQFFDINWEDADDIADYMDEVAMSTQSTEDRLKQLQDAAREALRGEGLDESTIEHLVNGGDVGWLQYADKFDESTQRILANLYELQGQMDAIGGGDPLGLTEISDDADQAQQELSIMARQLQDLGIEAQAFRQGDSGFVQISIESFASTLADSGWSQESISAYMNTLMASGHYEFTADGEVVADTTEADAAINSVLAEKGKLSDAEATSYKVTGSGESQQNNILRRWAEITKNKTSKYDIYETTHKSTTGGDQKVNGTAHASGSWGTARSERALTGELGTELVVDPGTGRWYTVGENGAEFVNIPKGSIVFNHKQTEAILNNGFVTGRGRAYASGSGSIRKYSSSSYGGYSSSSSSSKKGKTSGSSSSKSSTTNSSNAKTELDNWFERRYEEHQHLLAMEQESQARYLDWLMDSYQLAYDEGIITLEELHKYQEEVFNGLREMYEDYLDDIEHEVSMREHFKGEEQAIIKLYQEAIASIQAEIDEARAAGLTDTDDYVQKLQDRFWKLTEALEKMEDDYTKNAESTTDKLIDLRQKMIKQEIKDEQDALKKRLSNLKDFYQKQKDLLQDSYDDEKYIKEQTEKRKSVTDIQMELERLSLDNSAWAQKRRLELSEELAKAQEELDEFEKDHALDMAKEQLDEMYELQETAINDRIDLLDEKLDYAKGIYDQALEDIRNGSIELYEDMILYNNRYGDGIADTITATWEDAYAALQDYYNLYNEDFNNIHLANATNYSTSGSWDSHSISDKGTSVTEATEYPANNKSGQWKKNSKGWWYEYNNGEYPTSTWENIDDKWYHFNSSGYMQTGWVKSNGYWYYLNSDGTMASNTWKKYNGKWYYLGANGQMKTGWFKDGNTWYYLNSSGAMVTGSQKIGDKTYHFGSSGAWLGYAAGTKHAVSGLHKVDEHGDEYVFESANGNRYRMFSGGEKVLNAQATNFLYQFATSGGKILTDLIKNSFNRGDLERVSNSRQNVEINMGDIIISGNADQRTVSQIRREQREGIDYVLTQFAKLNK